MEIRLIRHGKPASAQNPKLTALGFVYWIKTYNTSNVASDSPPPLNLQHTIKEHYTIASSLPRAVHSAVMATGNVPEQTLSVLRELEIPRYKLPLKLNAWTWVYLSRLLWYLGFKGNFETYKAGKQRAFIAADKLIELAVKHDNIAVFSHGVINIYIRRRLKQLGWCELEKSNKYWGMNRFVK